MDSDNFLKHFFGEFVECFRAKFNVIMLNKAMLLTKWHRKTDRYITSRPLLNTTADHSAELQEVVSMNSNEMK